MNIINLTPHNINIYNENGDPVLIVKPTGTIARIGEKREKTGTILGFPIFKTIVGEPESCPPQIEDTIYIVSGMFRSHVNRSDLYQPGELLRDGEGRPIGCIGLSQ